jgi:hypothetical protein
MNRVNKFNERLALVISNATGNMWFFWAAFMFCLILRVMYPPKMSEFLLDIENDFQLLLLAVNAVVGAHLYANQMKQLEFQNKVLASQDAMLSQIQDLLSRIEADEQHMGEGQDDELRKLDELSGGRSRKIDGDE